jgi:hypothetical protein
MSGVERLKASPQWAEYQALIDAPGVLDKLKASAALHGDQKYNTNTDQGKAYAQYGKDVTAQRKAEKKFALDARHEQSTRNVAQGTADLAAKHGLSPLVLAMLQRSQGLRGLGG